MTTFTAMEKYEQSRYKSKKQNILRLYSAIKRLSDEPAIFAEFSTNSQQKMEHFKLCQSNLQSNSITNLMKQNANFQTETKEKGNGSISMTYTSNYQLN